MRSWAVTAAMVGCLVTVVGCTSHPSASAPLATSSSTTASSASSTPAPASSTTNVALPRPAHVVIVVEENHSFGELTDATTAPFLAGLAERSAVFTQSYAVTHPSQPNYLALFSGSTQGVSGDSCPHVFGADNLGHQLLSHGFTFTGYSEDLPNAGATTCSAGAYARKHSPWVDFSNLPSSVNQPMSAFPADYAQLPTVSFVIPNLVHDMHSASVGAGDQWLAAHLGGYATWASTHDSLLVVTADEDDFGGPNRVLTLIAGAGVRAGSYSQRIDHYSLLRTVEQMYGLPPLGHAATASAISGVWN